MERKRTLFKFKNLFYIIFAVMFAGFGLLFAQKPETASAINVESVEPLGNQTLKARPFFLRKDFVMKEDTSSDPAGKKEETYANSLLDQDTFFYSANDQNSLRLSFAYNGTSTEGQADEIFSHVFYPDPQNRANFQFFSNINPSLKINGQVVDLSTGTTKYVTSTNHTFPNSTTLHIQDFEIVFGKDGNGEHAFSVFKQGQDEKDQFMEGVYELSVEYTICSTTNGTAALDQIQFTQQSYTETYSFFVTNRTDYLTNDRPNMENGSFDHVVEVQNTIQSQDAFLLYSNYSSEEISTEGKGAAQSASKIPYVEYDYKRYEAEITKELSNVISSTSLRLNIDKLNGQNEPALVMTNQNSTSDIVDIKIDEDNHKVKVYFTDLGVYNIILKPILVVEYNNGKDASPEKVFQKYNLDGVASVTRTSKVHMFGFQLFHTDFDHPADSNNIRPLKEMKQKNFESELFTDEADITSKFLHSNDAYSQNSEEKSSSTFTQSNIFNFINKKTDTEYSLTPVKTNQSPLRFISNASLLTDVESEVYTTAKISTFTEVTNSNLQGETVYKGTFDGIAQNTPGKYVYVLRYTYNNFNQDENTPATTQVFRQIFFFEIDKAIPDISIKTGDTNVSRDKFLNQDVTITDTTKGNPYNKGVTIQIYAWDYSKNNWMDNYSSSGISLKDLSASAAVVDPAKSAALPAVTLTKSAKYTVRYYYTNEIGTSKVNLETGSGCFREITFTIDKNPIENITARNFQQISGTSKYFFHSNIADGNFSTNQPIAFSWDEKASEAKTWAYYRYFPLQHGVLGQFYPKDTTKVSNLLTYFVSQNILPVNAVLDLSANSPTSSSKDRITTEKGIWMQYAGNTKDLNANNLDKKYINSDAGLYLLDVYDEAGNHKLDLFLIDDTQPIFVIHETNGAAGGSSRGYYIPTSSFLNTASTLHWGKHKAIFISGINKTVYTDQKYKNSEGNAQRPTEQDLTEEFYKTYDNKTSVEIYDLMRNLFDKNQIQNLSPNGNGSVDKNSDGVSSLIENYDSLYVTIEIENTSYYMDKDAFTKQTDVDKKEFKDPLSEVTYTILIRDKSNTKKYTQWADDAEQQFTSYYSARQIIIISFDSSQFFIQYETNSQGTEYITSNNVEKEGVVENDGQTSTTGNDSKLTTYLNPTRMNKQLYVTFKPKVSTEQNIQVEEVTIQYYEFKAMSKTVGQNVETGIQGTKYWYYAFTDTPTEPEYLYKYDDKKEEQEKDEAIVVPIRANSNGVTEAGKYVITRKYKTGEGYSINSGDYVTRTYVLIVDRNDVVSNQQLVTDASGKTHNEDLVGGDIFVAMYDSGTNTDLVVTFPNSENSNTNGAMLYSNNLTTNELPIKLYVPQFKYTTYVEKVQTQQSYEFDVKYDFAAESVEIQDKTKAHDRDTMNYYNVKKENLIREYALYAEIYKDANPAITTTTPIAATSTDPKNPTFDNVKGAANEQGFLTFYSTSNTQLQMIYQPGTYYVRIYQGMFGTGTGENLYTKTFDFSFVVESTTPNFDVTTTNGLALSYDEANGSTPMKYYTNQSKLNISWDKSRNEFLADIDVTKIQFSSLRETFTYDLSNDTYSQGGHTNIWDTKPEEKNYVFSGILNLQALQGVYQNDGYVDITMQYENHDVAKNENGQSLYSKITKRIFVDLCAPSDNVENLVQRSLQDAPMSDLFNHSALRTYLTADNNTVTNDLQNTSYNISNSADQNIFAYYSYSVGKEFLSTLKSSESTQGSTTYLRKFKIGDINTKYTAENKETSPSEFNAAKDFALAAETESLDANTYYEVVEVDKARNMSIYTIFVSDAKTKQNLLTYVDENNTEKSYTTEDFQRVASHSGAIHNIFARTGFELRSINFFGDEWARLKLTTFSKNENGNVSSSVTNLMLTPYDKENAYLFVGNEQTKKVPISSLIDGKQSIAQKHKLEIFNRVDGSQTAFYFNIFNTPLTPMPTSTSERELLTFTNMPDDKIQNTELSQQAFVVGMKITVDGQAIYSGGLDEDQNALQVKNPLGYANLWKNFTTNPSTPWQKDEMVRVFVNGNQLCFEVNPNLPSATKNSRVVYEFTDNYGITYIETHIFRETVISSEISSANPEENPLYAYYDETSVKLNYIIKDGLQYNFNENKYHVEYYEIVTDDQGTSRVSPTNMTLETPVKNNGITTWTFKTKRGQNEQYHDNFVLVLYDQLEYETNNKQIENISPKKEIYFSLYDQLPRENLSTTQANKAGQFQFRDVNNNFIPSSSLVSDAQGYYSQIRITFSPLGEETFIPIRYMYRTEETDWKDLTSGTRLQNTTGGIENYYIKIWYDEQYLRNELGNGEFVFSKVPESQIFQFSLSSLTSNYWVEKTEDGITSIVKKAEHSFKSPDGNEQYSNHYIVNVSKENVKIKVNNEQKISGFEKADKTWTYSVNDQQIQSEKYVLTNRNSVASGVPVFETTIVITYIPNQEKFLNSFFTLDTNGTINTSENLVSGTQNAEKMLVVQKGLDMDRTQIIWSKYFIIPENEINIEIRLGDKKLDPVVFTKTVENEECKYIYLTYSGLYTIQFKDVAGNIQRFENKDANGNVVGLVDKFEFIFLKDAPFTVTYTNPETGEVETSLPVKQAVYNNYVTLNIDQSTLTRFYRADGYPSFLDYEEDAENPETRKYLVKRNGVTYQKEFENKTQFTFDQPGYYEIAFASISSLSSVGSIRQETYQFTIINQNEFKVSHVFNKFANYYVEKVQKRTTNEFVDITENLVESLGVDTLLVDGKSYMTQLPLSYLDEKTGVGEYLITINTNNRLDKSESIPQRFTYKVNINSGSAPLQISLKEGESTTGSITINYNLSNLYYEMGESTLRIVRQTDNNSFVTTSSVQVNSQTTGVSSLSITTSGTYFVQVISPSGNLLFTYKVVRTEPLNAAAIIAIVIGSIVFVAVIFIIIKLRKRISVK